MERRLGSSFCMFVSSCCRGDVSSGKLLWRRSSTSWRYGRLTVLVIAFLSLHILLFKVGLSDYVLRVSPFALLSPNTSFIAFREADALLDAHLSPYMGAVFHQPPIVLWFWRTVTRIPLSFFTTAEILPLPVSAVSDPYSPQAPILSASAELVREQTEEECRFKLYAALLCFNLFVALLLSHTVGVLHQIEDDQKLSHKNARISVDTPKSATEAVVPQEGDLSFSTTTPIDGHYDVFVPTMFLFSPVMIGTTLILGSDVLRLLLISTSIYSAGRVCVESNKKEILSPPSPSRGSGVCHVADPENNRVPRENRQSQQPTDSGAVKHNNEADFTIKKEEKAESPPLPARKDATVWRVVCLLAYSLLLYLDGLNFISLGFPLGSLMAHDVSRQQTIVNWNEIRPIMWQGLKLYVCCTVVVACLHVASFCLNGFDWGYLDSCILANLEQRDLSPNIGIHWYMFQLIFERYKTLFSFLLHAHYHTYSLPLVFVLYKKPLAACHVVVAVALAFQPYPTIADFWFTACLYLIHWEVVQRMAFNKVLSFALGAIVIYFAMECVWLGRNTANANYLYNMQTVFQATSVALMVDFTRCNIKIITKQHGWKPPVAEPTPDCDSVSKPNAPGDKEGTREDS